MSPNIDEMIARHRELEQIAINPATDATTRRRATEERLNLSILIQKDQQEQLKRQNARIADDKEHTAKVQAVMDAMAENDNELCRLPVGSQERAQRVERGIALRLQLDKLQTFTGGV